jgi:hypothetical protein
MGRGFPFCEERRKIRKFGGVDLENTILVIFFCTRGFLFFDEGFKAVEKKTRRINRGRDKRGDIKGSWGVRKRKEEGEEEEGGGRGRREFKGRVEGG